uniref:(California timema) hypothetical protein n=1 Tax=Timema californicum TaxID=61474 RepID=A0A7R9PAX7_TIMCA|nr:unnamed protein product [Timema californicum]
MSSKTGTKSGKGGKSGVGKSYGGKNPLQNLSVDQNDDPGDRSVQQKPMSISIKSVPQLCKLLQNGTEEVQQVLTNEINIMMECKMCFNIFRSLANLLAHKRFYCQERYGLVFGDLPDKRNKNKVNYLEYGTNPGRLSGKASARSANGPRFDSCVQVKGYAIYRNKPV